MRLIDPQAIHIAPESTGGWQTNKLKEPTHHRIQPDIDKMPQAIEPNKEQHQNPYHHPVVPQVRFSTRPPVDLIEHLFKLEQVQELDQSQKAPKGAEPFRARAESGRSRDFSRSTGAVAKAFTGTLFRDSFELLFNHLGYLLFTRIGFGKLNPNRKPRWFSIFYSNLGAKSRY
jgi:hypothetical protein